MRSSAAHRRLIAPEIIQTSAMDCGPASLKCLLEGFGISVSYGRLREACQTDVDGTSIDTLEEVAGRLGLDAEQIMLPVDHLLRPEVQALPALVVIRLPSGLTHFVVIWRRFGPFVQVMDPGSGRRWLSGSRFLKDVYVHSQQLPAAYWHDWARSEDFIAPLRRRLAELGLEQAVAANLIEKAVASADWRALAVLDATVRTVAGLVRAKGVRHGREAHGALQVLLDKARCREKTLPDTYWSVRAVPSPPAVTESDEEMVTVRGAVLIAIRGRLQETPTAAGQSQALGPELTAALTEPPTRPGRELLRALRGDGLLAYAMLAGGLALAAASLLLEVLILRAVIDIGRDFGLVTQRLEAAGYFLLFTVAVLFIELRTATALRRLGRRLETRLRLALLDKIPRLGDRYFHSRPVSDMAERSHAIHQLRRMPPLGGQLVRATCALVLTTLAIAWLFPPGFPLAAGAACLAVGLPLIFKPHLEELDLRMRTHNGALSRFYLDALLGLTAIRAHGAEHAVRREHESLLVEWVDAGRRRLRAVVTLDALQSLAGFGFAAWLLFRYTVHSGEPAAALLLAYWALYLPVLGEQVALLVRQYPGHRNLTLRLLEPLGAPEDDKSPLTSSSQQREHSLVDKQDRGVEVVFEAVSVRAAGHTILQDIDLAIAAGEHLAIVGVSGAGKSSLVGLLLGWHRAAGGRVLADGQPLDGARLERLRRQTIWVSPSVQLWNRPLLANLTYGAGNGKPQSIARVLEDAELYGVLERLPHGLQSNLGEGGGLVSGGEGQRVRLGRGMFRPEARLVILDEPFQGLERARRRELLTRARQLWRLATLLCITHDVSDTEDFARVLVLEAGRIVEDGAPAELATVAGTRYRALRQAEDQVNREFWNNALWRRLHLAAGRLQETDRKPPA
jgi:ABC-type bacteriocin/lantibiotic exporter with double-glycine peptidase domain